MLTTGKEIYLKIESLAFDQGFVGFGSAKAAEVSSMAKERYLRAMQKGYFANMEYLKKNIEKRFNPTLLVEGAKSVLVFLAPYSLPKDMTPPAGVSQYALGTDYHTIIKARLFKIMEELKKDFPEFSGRAFTDSAPVLEREWAVRCGLGFIGKNNFFISRECGIKNFIAVIICNLEIPQTLDLFPDRAKNMECGCGDCTNCLKKCPTGALSPDGVNANRCISYHTIENKDLPQGILTGELPQLGGQYFGCDGCLDACPWNKMNKVGWSEFHTNCNLLRDATPQWWNSLSHAEFKKIFKDSPILRGGLDNIKSALLWGKKGEDYE